MSNLSVIQTDRAPPPLIRSLLVSIAEGFNLTVQLRRVDKATVNVMVGFFAASTIACSSTGNHEASALFREAGNKLDANWPSYESVVRGLIEKLKTF